MVEVKKKILKLLLKLKVRSKKDEEVGIVGLEFKEQRKGYAFLCSKIKKN